MRTGVLTLALLLPLPALASYVIHPTPGDPNPPAIIATASMFHSSGSWVLDRHGQVWQRGGSDPWMRMSDWDPPVSASELMFWDTEALVTTAGELWWRIGPQQWTNQGAPLAPAAAGSDVRPVSDLRAMPNPSSDSSRIAFTLPTAGPVSVRIFDATGRLVRTVLEGELPAGEAVVEWDGRSDQGEAVAAGVYFSRVGSVAGVLAGRILRR